jgi:hypothetical protein
MKTFIALSALASALLTLGGCETWVNPGFANDGPQLDSSGNCVYNVTRKDPNSWLLVQPEMHLIFWGNFSAQAEYQYQHNWSVLLSYPTVVLDRLAEYGIQTGSLDSQYYNPLPTINLPQNKGAVPGVVLIDDGSISTELNSEIQTGKIPPPNDNTLYMIMLPPSVLTHNMYYGSDAGYHAHAIYGSQRYTWAIVRYYVDFNSGDEIISHEMAEAATDPDTSNGWRDYTPGRGSLEIADICVWQPTYINGYTVQKYWSQGACQCL